MTTLPMYELDKQHLKIALALTNVGVFTFNPQKQEIRWDEQMYNIFGFANQKDSITCEQFHNLIFPDDKEKVQNFFSEMSLDKRFNDIEFRLLPTKERQTQNISMRAKVITNDQKEIIEIIGICSNITAFKVAKNEADNPAKDLFLETISHELRTPLTAILGFTGTLLMKLPGPINEAQEKQLNTIKSNTKRIITLIDNFDLFDFARVESGNVAVHLQVTEMEELLNNVSQTLSPLLQTKGVDFQVKIPPNLKVKADIRITKQIILNLVNFIVRYSKANKITLTCSSEEQIKIMLLYNNLNSETNSFMGLDLSKQLAKLMKSRIEHISSGQESFFILAFPKLNQPISGETPSDATENTVV